FRLSSLPSGIPLASLVRLAKLRRRIEHDYQELKQLRTRGVERNARRHRRDVAELGWNGGRAEGR
ncbi:hypothetical protein, partial [Streptomyces sp. NPDC005969]|uniref:hypothetical protein n=1 Tax=Streptomyces sp. NPDC005969 TaxID=3156722 RepID=UPI00340CA958